MTSHPSSAAVAALVCSVVLLSFLGRSAGHPTFTAEGALKREKRAASCPELRLDGESAQELTGAPQSLLVMLGLAKPTHFVLFTVEYKQREGRRAVERGGREIEVCKGWREVERKKEDIYVVVDGARSPAEVLYVVFPAVPSLEQPLTVHVGCTHNSLPKCFQLVSEDNTISSNTRVRRDTHGSHYSSSHSEGVASGGVERLVVWVCGGVVGVIGLLAVLAMCTHSSEEYQPEAPDSRTTEEVAAQSELTTAAPKSESMMNLLNDESASPDQPASSEGKSATTSVASSEGAKLTPSQRSGSQDPLVQPGNETVVRSKDSPKLGLPTLKTADSPRPAAKKIDKRGQGEIEEDGGGYAAVKKPSREYDYVDKKAGGGGRNAEDESGYAYATVGGARGQGPARPAQHPAGEGDAGRGGREGKENNEKASGLPPYGKVTRHMVPVSKRSGYSEVLTSSPMLPPGRPRAVTEPIDPAQADSRKQQGQGQAWGMRDDRAFTESAANLPLPQIPRLNVSEDVYDSISDEVRESVSTPASAPRNPSSAGAEEKPIRESLYESVEIDEAGKIEGDEDMYESVPEDIRQMAPSVSSPDTLSPPTSPFPPPPRSPSLTRTKTEVSTSATPPASPLQKERPEEDGRKKGKEHSAKESKSDQKKHKALSKAKSDTVTDARGRSLSSLFSRRKAPSNAASNTPPSPKTKKEKIQHEPLPKVPTTGSIPSPTHLPPSPPPMPAPPPPPDEEEDEYPMDGAYDIVEILNPRGAALLNSSAKAKSSSLPASMRASGGSMIHTVDHGPLPDLPEESAGGLVARERIPEDMDPEYDTVVLRQVQNDPSYDSVEVTHGADAMPKLEPVEPPRSPPPLVAPPAEGEGGQTPANRYARVSAHAAVDSTFSPPDLTASSPDHDELGYAVIPAHLKMRKRAMSDAMLKRREVGEKARPKSTEMEDQETSGNAIPASSEAAAEVGAAGETSREPTPPMEPEYESVTDAMREVAEAGDSTSEKKETPYARVDMAAKRRSQLLKQQSVGLHGLEFDADKPLREVSPNPPPLPQQGDLGDMSEFRRPPVPLQAMDSLELIDPSDLQPPPTTVNPYSQIDVLTNDPPYASVKKKSVEEGTSEDSKAEGGEEEDENPYSTVSDNIDGIVRPPGDGDPPYANVQKGRVMGDKGDQDPGPGYAKAGSKCLAGGGSGESATVVEGVNGTHCTDQEEEDNTYDRLDHGLGNAASCRANFGLSPPPPPPGGAEGEYSTVTVDFSTSPELVVTHTDSVRREENGVIRQVEETTINFTD